jgi:phage terminase large subunit-like protein
MWLNQIVADEDTLSGPADWADLEDESLLLVPGDEIVMGLDGGKTDDDTAQVGIRASTRRCSCLGTCIGRTDRTAHRRHRHPARHRR